MAGVAVASFGGPLALAALSAPGLLSGVSNSAGLAVLVSVAVFSVPLGIWLRYSRHVAGAGGLTDFVEAAAGRRVALAQGAIWIVSYLLYLFYTTVQIVYDVLPAVLPGERRWQTLLALGIPVFIAAVMVAGRGVALLAIGAIAVGQLVLAGILDVITLSHVATPASTFTVRAASGGLAKAGAQTSLLYVCGSLPLFLGGELATPRRTLRRGLVGAFLLTGLVVLLAAAPLASLPAVLGTPVPGVTVARAFGTFGLGTAIGIGVAASIAGVMLCEYLALSRLVHSLAGWSTGRILLVIGTLLVLAAPLSLIDPGSFYSALLKPSLIALWVSQLIVVAVYPLFARRHGGRLPRATAMSVFASGLMIYGLWTGLQTVAS